MRRTRNRRLFGLDLLCIPIAIYVSYVMHDRPVALGDHLTGYLVFATSLVLIATLLNIHAHLYATYWPAASTEPFQRLAVNLGVASMAAAASTAVVFEVLRVPLPRPPIEVAILGSMFTIVATISPRLAIKSIPASQVHRRVPDLAKEPALIAGAGKTGIAVLRDIVQHPDPGIEVIGFLDDDPGKHGQHIFEVPVLGSLADLDMAIARRQARLVLIAMPSAPGSVVRRIMDVCNRNEVEVRVIPGMNELLTNRVRIEHRQPVDLSTLLRRSQVTTNMDSVVPLLRGKRVLITGAGGSIGSELSRQVLRCRPSELFLLGHGENSIFEIERELRDLSRRDDVRQGDVQWPVQIHPIIADVRSENAIQRFFERHCPDVVFHAAACKHVPMMEASPIEAVMTNVFGTRNILQSATRTGTDHVILVSTDKAVYPTSIMGATKRIAELLAYESTVAHPGMCRVVRFGNVIGSRGSVVQTMQRQIATGGPVTVTHPDMTRYFMTIPEAVHLVLQTLAISSNTHMFIIDMGEPVRILDVAHDLIRLSGRSPETDIRIAFTGIRPGEKLHETLIRDDEYLLPTGHPSVRAVSTPSPPELHYLWDVMADLQSGCDAYDELAIRRALSRIVDGIDHERDIALDHPSAPTV